jgi:hypothetical protein
VNAVVRRRVVPIERVIRFRRVGRPAHQKSHEWYSLTPMLRGGECKSPEPLTPQRRFQDCSGLIEPPSQSHWIYTLAALRNWIFERLE